MTESRVGIARVYDDSPHDGAKRVLVDRLWPRGLAKASVELDEWCKQVAPSPDLRRWYGHDPQRFMQFRRRYRAELATGEQAFALAHLRDLARDRTIVLLTASKDIKISHAAVLAELLTDDRH
jgi:uncharacterized protein YeaO (DUF488 family)